VRGEGLRDLSVSRSSFKWGIPVPGDPDHVMYVWFDALANYLTALGDGELKAFWPPDLQLVGKDIIRFHTIYWPAFLMSAGFGDDQLPRTVFAHGFLTMNGLKMSKSLRNGVNPVQLADAFGADELRYYLLREIAFGQDGDFAVQALINRIRSELASTLGNLLHRSLGAFAVKFFEGRVPAVEASAVTDADRALQKRATELAADAAQAWKDLEPHRALECAITLAIAGNKYFDESAPWGLAKNPDQKARLGVVIYHVLEVLRIASTMLWPALPNKMNALRAQIGLAPIAPKPGADLWPAAWGELASGTRLAPGQPVFRNITKDDEAALLKQFDFAAIASADGAPAADAKSAKPAKVPAGEKPAPAEGGTPGVIQFTDVEKVDLRLGHVKNAERIPKKDKLLKLTVDLGEESGPRTIIAGVALAYAPEALVGKQIVVVSNLAPRDFGKGLVSHGMLLACGPSESLSVLTIERPMPAGTRVK
jgi:methionyl-tRNA synthetase